MPLTVSLATLAAWLQLPPPSQPEQQVVGVSRDSRQIAADQLYIALRGDRFDGHAFLAQVAEAGAAAAVVEQLDPTAPLPQLRVEDSRHALATLARRWRETVQPTVIGITGSNGKTTVKSLCHALFSRVAPTLATVGNLNNEIGVPLTLLQLSRSDRYAVVEMGANHRGEIDTLTHLAQPDVAILTNATEAHLAGFGSLEGVVAAKGEIFNALAPHGTAVLNRDSPFFAVWQQQVAHLGGRTVLSFGFDERADIYGEWQPREGGTAVTVRTPNGTLHYHLPLLGGHNVVNSLAAVAAAVALGVDDTTIEAALTAVVAVAGRLHLFYSPEQARVIDDSYNANPASMAAAVEVLASYGGERLLIIGDMGELGVTAPQLHRQIGHKADVAGIDRLWGVGVLSAEAVAAFGEGGRHFSDQAALLAALRPLLHPQMTVLIKGSRAAQMDRIAAALQQTAGA